MTQDSPVQMRITKGELVKYNEQEYVVLKVVDLTQVLARNAGTKNTELLEIRHLSPWVVKQADDTDKKDIDLLDVSEADWEEARRRLEAIRPMLTRQERGSGLVERVSKETGHSPATLYRWRDFYLNSGLLTSLLPTKRRGERGKAESAQK